MWTKDKPSKQIVNRLSVLARESHLIVERQIQTCALQPTDFKDAFSDIALFFHDVYGGDLIGILWKPQSFVPAPFKVLHAQCKMPLINPQTAEKSKQGQTWVIPNISAILSDFQTIGEGLVKKIEVLNA